MLSPVSPSATGNTLRSLTSSRRASSSASAPSTTARKRIRLGSATAGRPPRLRLGDLAGLQAARAHVHAPRRTARLPDAHLLQVRVEPPLGGDHRMGAGLPERGALAAGMTDSSHCGREHSGPARANWPGESLGTVFWV